MNPLDQWQDMKDCQDELPIEKERLDYDETYEIREPFDPRQIDISVEIQNIGYLLDLLNDDLIDLNSDFQRSKDLWSPAKMSRFIESLIVRLPIPPFYLTTPERIPASKENQFQVVDGLQRLSTLRRFVMENRLHLRELELLPDLNGSTFDRLPRPLQRAIERAQITVYLIRPNTPKPVKFIIFNRMNTGGLTLNDQEIRHALNPGRPAKYLDHLIATPSFRSLIRVRHARMRDQELALRYLAFRLTKPDHYKRGLRRFLDIAMGQIDELPDTLLRRLNYEFEAALATASSLFGSHAFSRTRQKRPALNKALFDTWTVNLATLSSTARDALIGRRADLEREYWPMLERQTPFSDSVSKDTSSPESVKHRFGAVAALLSRFTTSA